MSRLSGIPSTSAISSGRFAGLKDALGYGRIDRIRAAARGETFSGRLGTTKGAKAPEPTPKPSPTPAPSPPPKPAASAPSPKREPWKVPSEVAAQGANAELAYRVTFEAVTSQLGRMSSIPAAKGRIGSLIEMVASGSSDAEIRAGLPEMPTDRQRQISATWDAAIAAVCTDRGSALSSDAEVDGFQPRDAARQRMIAVANDDLFIGNEAKALNLLTKEGLYGLNAADMLDVLALSTGSDRTAGAVWDRAHAAVFGTAHAPKSDPHGWQAIHADIRERRG